MEPLTTLPARPARAALRDLGAFALAGTGLSVLYAATGLGLPCPFRYLTGWLCPLCGGTHMGVALLTGDLAGAWAANPLLLVAAVLTGVRAAGWVAELARDPGATTGVRWVPWRLARHWGWVLGVVGVVYVIVRNLG